MDLHKIRFSVEFQNIIAFYSGESTTSELMNVLISDWNDRKFIKNDDICTNYTYSLIITLLSVIN